MKPLIGIAPDTHNGKRLKARTPKEKIVYLWDQYLVALTAHGALPVVLPVTEDHKLVRAMADRLDGVMLAGGNFDVPPDFYGEEPTPWLGKLKPERSRFELALTREAIARGLPVLGICGGMQTINVAYGGTLYQDIANERPKSRSHQQKTRPDRTCHQVKALKNTRLKRCISGRKGGDDLRLRVNSTHHQAIKDVAPGYVVNAVAADGMVEGIESEGAGFVLGVQWHPELLFERHEAQSHILRAFVRAAAQR